jgi:hypothetical protein
MYDCILETYFVQFHERSKIEKYVRRHLWKEKTSINQSEYANLPSYKFHLGWLRNVMSRENMKP